MIEGLLKNVEVDRIMESVAAGQAANLSDAVDMAGFESVLFSISFGAIDTGGIATVKVSQCDSEAGSYADLLGRSVASSADTDAQGIILVEIKNPEERYLKVTVTTSIADVEIDTVTAFKFGAKKLPITENDDIIDSEQHVRPAEGTA